MFSMNCTTRIGATCSCSALLFTDALLSWQVHMGKDYLAVRKVAVQHIGFKVIPAAGKGEQAISEECKRALAACGPRTSGSQYRTKALYSSHQRKT